jgi:hypothetical protein
MKTIKATNVKFIRPHDANFTFNDGTVVYRRAALEIRDYCPDYYKQVIQQAYDNGWITPVAIMPENEFILMGLSN